MGTALHEQYQQQTGALCLFCVFLHVQEKCERAAISHLKLFGFLKAKVRSLMSATNASAISRKVWENSSST